MSLGMDQSSVEALQEMQSKHPQVIVTPVGEEENAVPPITVSSR